MNSVKAQQHSRSRVIVITIDDDDEMMTTMGNGKWDEDSLGKLS